MTDRNWTPIGFKDFDRLVARPLEEKIEEAVGIIREAISLSKHQIALAFSGGKDSTVLWHILRTHCPDCNPYVIFGNTGIEYPESLQFARKLGKEWGRDRFREARPEKLEEDGLRYKIRDNLYCTYGCMRKAEKVLLAKKNAKRGCAVC